MLVPLELPPGAFRNGTAYQSAGRFYNVNRVRWYGNALAPIGGWREKSTTLLTGMARAMISWRDNAKAAWAAVGTNSHLYTVAHDGVVADITPSGFTAGSADSSTAGGWGMGLWGAGTWGTPRADDTSTQPAAVWTLDTRGEDLIGCTENDGKIYTWSPGDVAATALSGDPGSDACFVTVEGSVVSLSGKTVAWSDGDDPTDWTPSTTNTAGDIPLQTNGALKCGARLKGGNLVWTELDVWSMTPTRDVLVYGFDQLATACGVISRQAVCVLDDKAIWMGQRDFFIYDGGVRSLPCDVSDYVFGNINTLQSAKVCAVRNSQFNEVWFFYPSEGSNENDRYVKVNHDTGAWDFGALGRLCGTDRGVFTYPLAVDASGQVWEHEFGFTYPDGVMPWAEGGPLELGPGDRVMHATKLFPDEATAGDVSVTFKTRFQPNGEETTRGPYTLSSKTDVRFAGRQVSVRYDGVRSADWRVGAFRLDVTPGGFR